MNYFLILKKKLNLKKEIHLNKLKNYACNIHAEVSFILKCIENMNCIYGLEDFPMVLPSNTILKTGIIAKI